MELVIQKADGTFSAQLPKEENKLIIFSFKKNGLDQSEENKYLQGREILERIVRDVFDRQLEKPVKLSVQYEYSLR